MRLPPRVHLVGASPRSGTTLMFELLVSCFKIEKFGDHEISLFKRPVDPKGPYASKQPMDFIHVCRVLRWDPMLHVIYMQRDPRDVVVSQHGGQPGRYWCDFDLWQRNQDLLPRLANHPRFFECRYEDLVTGPDQVQDVLAKKFPFLEKQHAFSEFDQVSQSSASAQLALKGVRKISSDSVGKWRSDMPRIAAQSKDFPCMSDYLVATGYEADHTWLSLLQAVIPDNSESVRAEHNIMRNKSRTAQLPMRISRRLSTLFDEIRYVAGYSKK